MGSIAKVFLLFMLCSINPNGVTLLTCEASESIVDSINMEKEWDKVVSKVKSKDYHSADSLIRNYMKLQEDTYGKSNDRYAKAISILAYISLENSNYAAAELLYLDFIKLYMELHVIDDTAKSDSLSPDLFLVMYNLGYIKNCKGMQVEADSIYKLCYNNYIKYHRSNTDLKLIGNKLKTILIVKKEAYSTKPGPITFGGSGIGVRFGIRGGMPWKPADIDNHTDISYLQPLTEPHFWLSWNLKDCKLGIIQFDASYGWNFFTTLGVPYPAYHNIAARVQYCLVLPYLDFFVRPYVGYGVGRFWTSYTKNVSTTLFPITMENTFKDNFASTITVLGAYLLPENKAFGLKLEYQKVPIPSSNAVDLLGGGEENRQSYSADALMLELIWRYQNGP